MIRIIIGGLFMLFGICELFAMNVTLGQALTHLAIGYLLLERK